MWSRAVAFSQRWALAGQWQWGQDGAAVGPGTTAQPSRWCCVGIEEYEFWAVAFSPAMGAGWPVAVGTRRCGCGCIQVDELTQLACQIANRNLTQDEWQRLLGNNPYHKTCGDLPVHPSVYKALLKETEELTKQGKITSALETLTKVQRLEPAAEIYVNTWYRLCWFGSLWKRLRKLCMPVKRSWSCSLIMG